MNKRVSEYLGKAVITEVVPAAQQSNYVVGRPAYFAPTPVQKAQENVNQSQANYTPPTPTPEPTPDVPVVETNIFKTAWAWVKENPVPSFLIAGVVMFAGYKLFQKR